MPKGSRVLIRVTTAGVLASSLATAATFTGSASGFTFLRYPLLGAALAALAMAGWGSERLPAFNRTLWANAPWWARLSWLLIIAAGCVAFATISQTEMLPTASGAQKVLETRGIGAVAAYFFLIAGLRSNVDLNRANTGLNAEPSTDLNRPNTGLNAEPSTDHTTHPSLRGYMTGDNGSNRKTAG
jgi:hypothetical protein